jgi:hypothetical protein
MQLNTNTIKRRGIKDRPIYNFLNCDNNIPSPQTYRYYFGLFHRSSVLKQLYFRNWFCFHLQMLVGRGNKIYLVSYPVRLKTEIEQFFKRTGLIKSVDAEITKIITDQSINMPVR